MNVSKIACVAAILLLPATAMAGPSDELIAGMAKCAALTDNTARLTCYDGLAPQLKAALAEPPPAAADNRSWYDPGRIFGASPSAQTTPEQFGGENLAEPAPTPSKLGEPPPPPRPEALDSISAKVTDYAFNPFGRVIVFLDNGQVWRQIDGDTDHVRFKKGVENMVEISRGAIGSYVLTVNDAGVGVKVRRVK